MAKVVFISLYDRNAYGLRMMSANLRKHGHECHMIFMKRYDSNPTYKLDMEVGEYPWQGVAKSGRIFKYASNSRISETELDHLKGLIEDIGPDVIGTTVNTPLRIQSNKVTQFLKKHFDIPVIWGGYDPTVNPHDCLDLCDFACLGEGDETMLEIARLVDEGECWDDVKNLAYIRDGKKIVNRKHLAEQNLDLYPWRDNDPEFKYFIEDDKLERDYAVVNDKPEGMYQAMSARGCPYKCSYCCEATFKDLYTGEKFLRRRSPQDLVAELAKHKAEHGMTHVQFEDEIFAMTVKWLKEFAPLYKEQIGVPFSAYIYPTRKIEEILTVLRDAGLTNACLALESGSERINKQVFDRVYDRELFIYTAEICDRLGIGFYTDVITYNPYEEEQDLRDTLDVLVEIPSANYGMCINKLFVLPGTNMAKQMEKDGKTFGASEMDTVFDYYCRLFWIPSFSKNPRRVIDFIDSVGIFRKYPRLLNPMVVELLVNPASSAKAFVRDNMPHSLLSAIRERRRKADLERAAQEAAVGRAC